MGIKKLIEVYVKLQKLKLFEKFKKLKRKSSEWKKYFENAILAILFHKNIWLLD